MEEIKKIREEQTPEVKQTAIDLITNDRPEAVILVTNIMIEKFNELGEEVPEYEKLNEMVEELFDSLVTVATPTDEEPKDEATDVDANTPPETADTNDANEE